MNRIQHLYRIASSNLYNSLKGFGVTERVSTLRVFGILRLAAKAIWVNWM